MLNSKSPKSDDDRRRWYQENCGQVTSALNAIKGNAEQCEKKLEVLQEKTCRLQDSMKDLQVTEEKLKKKSAKTSPENETDHQKKNDKQLELVQLEITKETQDLTAFREGTVRVLLRISDSLLEKLQEAWGCIDVYEKQQKFVILDERNGPPEGALKELNDMIEVVNEVLVRVAQLFAYMGEINTSFQDDLIRKAVEKRLQLFNNAFLKNHLERIIVIDKHPNQVMKVSKGRSLKSTMSLRILGPVKLGLNVNRPRVTANLHAEKDSAKELEGSTVSQEMAIQNAENIEAKFDNSTKQLRVNFRTHALKRSSDGWSRDERVTEHKYGMIFSVKLIVTGKELLVKKLSLPIVLTTQSSQEWAAKGMLIWDAAFSEDQKRTIYQDAARVTWKDLGELLKNLFQMTTNRPLTPDSLQYLAQRLFGGGENEDFSAREVTKEMFIKNKLEGLSFSLWGWIHACINLIRQSISKEWEEGLIHGFVSREKADELMRDCPVGTFMLRFKASEISDSQSANNTAILAPSAVVDNGGNKNVHHWDFKKNLPYSKMNLARKLQSCQITSHDNEDLKGRPFRILYPDTPFENAFQGFIEEDEYSRMAVDTGTLLFRMQKENCMTDVTFVIQGTEVKAHRNVVFGRVGNNIKGLEEKQDRIEIDEMTLTTFNTVLQYLYTTEVKVTDANFFDLMQAAVEFKLACLESKCSEFLQEKTTIRNFSTHAKEAVSFGGKEYIKMVQEYFGRNTSIILKEETGVFGCPQDVLRVLCGSEKINCSELELFLGCVEWAKRECQKQKREESPENLRESLGDVLDKIRFSTIDLLDFQEAVVQLNILKYEEIGRIMVARGSETVRGAKSKHNPSDCVPLHAKTLSWR